MITDYNDFINESKNKYTEKDPEFFGIKEYEWDNGKLNCFSDVDLSIYNFDLSIYNFKLTKLPFIFGEIDGYFNCDNNLLTTLYGAPEKVKNYFTCSKNKLTNLNYCPKICGNEFHCYSNLLTSLEGLPKELNNLYCIQNNLSSIEDYPLSIIRGWISPIFKFEEVCEIVENNVEKFIPLLDNKIAFHQMVMRLKPELIKYYKTIQPPTKKSFLLDI